jgi:pimeloyl-ACP methyl ester carboxylesterase
LRARPGSARRAANRCELPRGFVASRGAALQTQVYGRRAPDRQVVVFVHDWAQDASVFDRQAAALRSRYTVVTWNLRGHGSSTDPTHRGGGVDEHAADLGTVIDAIAGPTTAVHVVGHGLGGRVAFDYARRRGTRVRSLTLIATVHALSPEVRQRYRELVAEFRRDESSFESWASRLIPVWVSHDFLDDRPDAVALFDAMLARHDASSVVETLDRSLVHEISIRDAGQVAAPTLVLFGTLDDTPNAAAAERLFGAMKDVKRLRIPSAGRSPHLEAPDAVNAALARHLGGS